jgi:hypothetical protein
MMNNTTLIHRKHRNTPLKENKMDINTLRKQRQSSFSKLSAEFEKTVNPQSESKSYKDDRFWKPEPDKAGNASATIRFLNTTDGDELPWVKIFTHGFQGPTGKWYIENSLTTIGENDPVGELNMRLWNSGSDADKETARKQKRKLSYVANVLIISDPKHPENEGQIKLFKFGKKIFDKIMDKARPTFDDEEPVNVFDYWEGADFKLKMIKVEGYPNYDKSTFAASAPVAKSDEDILDIAKRQHQLREFNDRKNFKTYEELARKLVSVLDGSSSQTKSAAHLADDSAEEEVPRQVAVDKKPAVKIAKATASEKSDLDDDDAMSYFKKMAEED